jgi:carbon storage regulator
MLVLARRTGETFRIGENIEITVVEVQGDKVRIGITAPREIRVLRGELLREVESANADAAAAGADLDALAQALGGEKRN